MKDESSAQIKLKLENEIDILSAKLNEVLIQVDLEKEVIL